MDRRDFIKTAGAGALAAGVIACTPKTKEVSIKEPQKGPEAMAHHLGSDIGLLGYGCMRWPTIKDENGDNIIDQEKVEEMVDYAIAHGVNYFDTAPVYLRGQSEAATAKALSKYPRESYYVATKLSNYRGEPTLKASVEMFEKSLSIFNTDYMDYYLLHNISSIRQFERRFVSNGMMDYLLKQREEGHIRKLGFSIHADTETFDYLMGLHDKYHWDFVQIQMNYLDWRHASWGEANADYMYETLDMMQIPVIIMEPLRGGELAEIPANLSDMLKSRTPDKSVASWAFRFCGTYPRVLTVLSGMTYIEHLKDNLDTYLDFKPLSDEELALLQKVADEIDKYKLVPCTACNYCTPCPYGIDIPGIFKFYNTQIKDGTYVSTGEQKDFARARRKYLLSYDKAVESVRQADHCIKCGRCASYCPQHIDIPEMLRRIDLYVEDLKKGSLQ